LERLGIFITRDSIATVTTELISPVA